MSATTISAPIENLNGKSAIFIRGFVEYLQERHRKGHRNAKLRAAQDAGASQVTRKGDVISVPYVSQLSTRLEKSGVYEKARSGKSYVISWTNESVADVFELMDTDYGTEEAVREVTVEDMKNRSKIIDHLDEVGGVVITEQSRVPRAAFRILWDRFNKGELMLGFFEPDDELVEDYPNPFNNESK